jgi:capsular exopolysaccharide synthesis family protein
MAKNADLSVYNHELAPGRFSARGSDEAQEETWSGPSPVELGSLHIITTGPCPPNPADLLASKRMKALVESLKHQADIVLFDTPPAMMVTDAVVLSKLVDGVLILADAGNTKRGIARQTVERFRQVDAHVLGVVLNRVSYRGSYYTYHRYYRRDKKES